MYLPKFLMTFFLVINLSHVLMWYFFRRGGKSVADIDIDTGVQNLTFRQIHNAIITLSALPEEVNSIANFDGEPLPYLRPPGSATASGVPSSSWLLVSNALDSGDHDDWCKWWLSRCELSPEIFSEDSTTESNSVPRLWNTIRVLLEFRWYIGF